MLTSRSFVRDCCSLCSMGPPLSSPSLSSPVQRSPFRDFLTVAGVISPLGLYLPLILYSDLQVGFKIRAFLFGEGPEHQMARNVLSLPPVWAVILVPLRSSPGLGTPSPPPAVIWRPVCHPSDVLIPDLGIHSAHEWSRTINRSFWKRMYRLS